MNNIIELKKRMDSAKYNSNRGFAITMPKNRELHSSHLQEMISQLQDIYENWDGYQYGVDPLVTVQYTEVIAKSNRVQALFGSKNDELIVGAKYSDPHNPKHIITYEVLKEKLKESINDLMMAKKVCDDYFGGVVNEENFAMIDRLYKKQDLTSKIVKTKFKSLIRDAVYVETIRIEMARFYESKRQIISFYKVNANIIEVLKKLGINITNKNMLDNYTCLLELKQVKELQERAPYLVAMAINDMRKIPAIEKGNQKRVERKIPDPTNEPIIGVIDTAFSSDVYFNKWVEYKEELVGDRASDSDTIHGTRVTSIIVDGPSLNPKLDDGCGRFRVRHFCVCKSDGYSSFAITKKIREIVKSNSDIHVWNLSLGTEYEIYENYISPEASELDKLQYEYNVLFVICGTNSKDGCKKIGVPADSINSIVVNSVDENNHPASYTRVGPVLSFYTKPDVSYYGGTNSKPMVVFDGKGQGYAMGTSYAAPWIARKAAYLIEVLGFSREVAKALIIDSAYKWNQDIEHRNEMGYGVVPIKIDEVVNCRENEIKFVLSGKVLDYYTFNNEIPVPSIDDRQCYVAKATMCYFPKCTRNQGVDYTNTELDLHFGQIRKENGKYKIKSIDDNTQCDEEEQNLKEKYVRIKHRKWDNVKTISERTHGAKNRKRGKKTVEKGLWGVKIIKKERLNDDSGKGLDYGIVVTLKELNDKNYINDFVVNCRMHGWFVREVDIENQINLYEVAEQEIHLD